jgi:hypothetical protein
MFVEKMPERQVHHIPPSSAEIKIASLWQGVSSAEWQLLACLMRLAYISKV